MLKENEAFSFPLMHGSGETSVINKDNKQIDLDLLQYCLNAVGIEVDELITEPRSNQHVLTFKHSNIRHVRLPIDYDGSHNCINIYHSESSKSGFWWDHTIDYRELADELLNHH